MNLQNAEEKYIRMDGSRLGNLQDTSKSLSTHTYFNGVVGLGEYIYCIHQDAVTTGGRNPGTDRYKVSDDGRLIGSVATDEELPGSANIRGISYATVAYNDRLYTFGGNNNGSGTAVVTDNVTIFNQNTTTGALTANTTLDSQDLPNATNGLAAVATDKEIYLMGGDRDNVYRCVVDSDGNITNSNSYVELTSLPNNVAQVNSFGFYNKGFLYYASYDNGASDMLKIYGTEVRGDRTIGSWKEIADYSDVIDGLLGTATGMITCAFHNGVFMTVLGGSLYYSVINGSMATSLRVRQASTTVKDATEHTSGGAGYHNGYFWLMGGSGDGTVNTTTLASNSNNISFVEVR